MNKDAKNLSRNKMKSFILLLFFSISLFAIQKANISDYMRANILQATFIIKQKDLSNEEKASKIFPLFDTIFDYKLMTKLSLGKENWIKMTQKQRAEFTNQFIAKLKQSYIDKLDLYTDEKLRIIGLKEVNKKRILLLTQLVGDKDTYDITYKFYKSRDNNWLIYDVNIVGVSLIQVYRAQFNGALQDGSYQTLLDRLKKSKK